MRKPLPKNIIVGRPVRPNAGITDRYAKALKALVRQMCAQTRKEILRAYDEHWPTGFAGDASIASQGRIIVNNLDRTFAQFFGRRSGELANGMVDDTLKTSSKTLAASFSSADKSGGLELKFANSSARLKEMMKAAVNENVALIKSIQSQYHEGVRQAVMRSITSGEGRQAIIDHLVEKEGQTLRRAENIAKDQTRKIYTTVTREKCLSGGLNKYIWNHSGGGAHPREMHQDLDGQICDYNNPPVTNEQGERNNPGDEINCGCYATPVIEIGDE